MQPLCGGRRFGSSRDFGERYVVLRPGRDASMQRDHLESPVGWLPFRRFADEPQNHKLLDSEGVIITCLVDART